VQPITGDFDDIFADYPECTQFVTSDVTLDVQGSPVGQVKATIEKYGTTPNGSQAYLLTVWNSNKKPLPKTFTVGRGPNVIGAGEPGKKKSSGKKKG
jgi:hypothetical protein